MMFTRRGVQLSWTHVNWGWVNSVWTSTIKSEPADVALSSSPLKSVCELPFAHSISKSSYMLTVYSICICRIKCRNLRYLKNFWKHLWWLQTDLNNSVMKTETLQKGWLKIRSIWEKALIGKTEIVDETWFSSQQIVWSQNFADVNIMVIFSNCPEHAHFKK